MSTRRPDLGIVSPGAASTPRAAPRPDWAEASAYRPDPVTFLDRSVPAGPSTPQRLTLLDALSLFAVAALIGGMLAVGHS